MRRLALICAALSTSLLLSGCATLAVPAPATVSSQTTLDERALMGAELSYKAARTLAEAAVDGGLVDAAKAAKIRDVDSALYDALAKARTAYRSSNAASYDQAIADIAPMLVTFWSLVAKDSAKGGEQ